MAEVILPGTYITIRDEALISAGRVATGNIGIVGTATRGELYKTKVLSSFSEAREIFGQAKEGVTLIPALENIFNNGGKSIYAVRVAGEDCQFASYQTKATKNGTAENLILLKACTQGSWGNEIKIVIEDPTDEKAYVEETLDWNQAKLGHANIDETSKRNSVQIIKAKSGRVVSFEIIYKDVPGKGQVKIDKGTLTFGEDPDKPVENDIILVAYQVTKSKKVTVGFGDNKIYRYIIADINHLVDLLNKTRDPLISTSNSPNPEWKDIFPDNDNSFFQGGMDGSGAGADQYGQGLEKLISEPINIVLLAGQDASNLSMINKLNGHIKSTSENKGERIGIIGASLDDADSVINEVASVNSDRVVFVAPGVRSGGNVFSAAHTAAAVAGLISSLPVQASPTNKQVVLPDLSTYYSNSQLERLIQKNVLLLEKREGIRIVKGITTSSNSAWHQITTRRIVDYAVYGVRSACNPYIGKLNNERVRGAMKATIDAFLTRMVNDEALISYELEVSASRAQEIAGEAIVSMTIRPTFSIDYILVTMYLG